MDSSLRVKQVESVRRVFTQEDFDRFATLSGDDNPIHVNPTFSARSKFGRPVAHGMLLYSAVCSVLGTRLPGPGTVQLEQELMFPSATYAGEQVTIELTITDLQQTGGLVDLNTTVVRPNGNVGLQGRTLVQLPGEARRQPHHGSTLLGFAPAGGRGAARERTHRSLGPSFKGLNVGQRVEVRRTFTMQDLEEYADLTGDNNPVFIDPGYARKLGLGGSIIPGSLLGGMFSYLLGTRLPGRGTNYLKQQLQFSAFARPDQELTAAVEIIRIRPKKQLINLRTICTKPGGEVICRGEALVLISDVEPCTERG